MIQGGGSSTMTKARQWLYKYPEDSHKLLQLITNVIIDYLLMQVKAGAQVYIYFFLLNQYYKFIKNREIK